MRQYSYDQSEILYYLILPCKQYAENVKQFRLALKKARAICQKHEGWRRIHLLYGTQRELKSSPEYFHESDLFERLLKKDVVEDWGDVEITLSTIKTFGKTKQQDVVIALGISVHEMEKIDNPPAFVRAVIYVAPSVRDAKKWRDNDRRVKLIKAVG